MLNGLGVAVAIYKLKYERLELYIIPIIWISINILYLFAAVIFDLRKSRTPKNFKPGERQKYSISAMLGVIWRGKCEK
jgi:hypothetical protein